MILTAKDDFFLNYYFFNYVVPTDRISTVEFIVSGVIQMVNVKLGN